MLQKLKCKLGRHRLVNRFEIREDGMSTLIKLFCTACKYQERFTAAGTHNSDYIDIPLRTL